ncbi:MAG: DUF1016 family protein [Chlorobi bacterium CHB2]|nr:DUF1016 family protein [Chlorobi bacterium CHB2]
MGRDFPPPIFGISGSSTLPSSTGSRFPTQRVENLRGHCTEKNETVARYSVLNDRKQIFASSYMLCLPTEEQLRREIEKERRLIETTLNERNDE